MLRRTKDQVLNDLPPKLVHDEPLDLAAEQRESYRLAEEEGVVRLTELGDAATIRHVFELVLRLKQICNFDPATGAQQQARTAGGRPGGNRRQRPQGDRLQPVGRHAQAAGRAARPLRPAGVSRPRCPSGRRDAVIERFRDDPSQHVLLMSYGAGGVGLNLQFVNYVFLFDRWWNPAVEDQAINRAHRIGVDGPVNVTRFLMLDTIEERIDRILQEKRELFDIDLLRRRGPPQARPDAGRALRAVPTQMPRRPDRPGGVAAATKCNPLTNTPVREYA